MAAVARAQAGVLTLKQAQKAGLSRRVCERLVAQGEWERIGVGVCRLAGSSPSWEQRVWAACLETGGAASHRSAGWLLGLDGIGRHAPREVEVVVPHGNKRSARDAVVHRSRSLLPAHLSKRPGLPMTNLPRTLIDLAEVLDAEDLGLAFDSALRQAPDLRRWLGRLLKAMPAKGRAGIGELAALLDEKTTAVDSALEVKLRRLLKNARVPQPIAGFEVRDDDWPVAKVDFAWPKNAPPVALWVHGARWHANTKRWRRDLAQVSQLSGLGWRVVQGTYDDVARQPDALLRNLRRALAGLETPGSMIRIVE